MPTSTSLVCLIGLKVHTAVLCLRSQKPKTHETASQLTATLFHSGVVTSVINELEGKLLTLDNYSNAHSLAG